MRSIRSLILSAVMVLLSFTFFSDSYSKIKDLSPPGAVFAQNDITHPNPSFTVNTQIPISVNHEIASALPVNESEGMVQASFALLSKPESARLTSKSLKQRKSEIRKSYIRDIERFTGFTPRQLC